MKYLEIDHESVMVRRRLQELDDSDVSQLNALRSAVQSKKQK